MADTKNKIDFDSSLKKLESIVSKLENNDVSLEDSVKSFEEGIKLVKDCQKQLSDAELKVKKLLVLKQNEKGFHKDLLRHIRLMRQPLPNQ